MEILITSFIIGISYGFILFLLGTGLSLTMGLMKIVNLAHGAIFMVGAYVGLTAARYTQNFLLGVFAGGIASGLVGMLMEVGFLRRLYKRNMDQALLTIGFVYVLINLVQWIWGPLPQSSLVPLALSSSIPIANLKIPVFRLVTIGVGLVAAAGLWFFQEKTRIGAIIRAGMDNQEMTRGLGIRLPVIFTSVFAFGAFVAGFCGLFGAQSLGISLDIGWDVLLLSMMVVVIGGTGSIQGALAGGLLIGLAETYGKVFFPDVAYFTMYALLIIVLLVRPSGLLGRRI
jgi:branched-chain amino acid transport system permease protein